MLDPENNDNELLAQMLEVMERLTAYAYCWNVSIDIGFDLDSLVGILDGRTDRCVNSELYTYSTSLYDNLNT